MLGVLNFLNKPLTIRWYLLNPSITTDSLSMFEQVEMT